MGGSRRATAPEHPHICPSERGSERGGSLSAKAISRGGLLPAERADEANGHYGVSEKNFLLYKKIKRKNLFLVVVILWSSGGKPFEFVAAARAAATTLSRKN